MYKDHFQLRAMPFSIAPDPGCFYLSNQHRDAWTHLRHAVDGDAAGVLLLTGEVGAGKTTVCRRLMGDLPGHVRVALVHNPRLTPHDLLRFACREFEVPGVDDETALDEKAAAELDARLARHLATLARIGQVRVLVIDEAQGLPAEVLAQLGRWAAAARSGQPGLRIVLIGQPELAELVARDENAAVDACITMRFHLGPLARAEVAGYVAHRLSVAGGRKALIPARLLPRLHRMSQGIPRVINLICDRALLGAFVQGRATVNRRILEQAFGEAVGRDAGTGAATDGSGWLMPAWVALGAAGLLATGAVLAVASRPVPAPAPAALLAPAVDVSLAGLDPNDPADWPDGVGGSRSGPLAYAALLRRWNLAPAGGEPPCDAVRRQGLACVQGRDEFAVLRRLDIPAVLELADAAGRRTHVALIEVRADQVVLQLGGSQRTLPIGALESKWTRQYTLLWRPPPEFAGSVEPGAKGPPVDWLRQRIARLKGVQALSLPPRLDGRLRSALQEFQSLEGLRPTGAGDLRTLVHLASRTDPAAPVLDPRHCKP
jgi:general secretion pathway protein A